MAGKRLRIATRKSELALWQARYAAQLLRARHPGLEVDLVPLTTRGDRILDRPLAAVGGKGLFLKELERALLDGSADLAVHSMKDVPVEDTPGLVTGVVLARANPNDALLTLDGATLEDLSPGARIGTSSLRRQCQLLDARPDLSVRDLRGNVNTRIGKLEAGEFDAIILACAGLERLGLTDHVSQELCPPVWLPAATQGTIGLQYRVGDDATREVLSPLQDAETAIVTTAERAAARRLEGSCHLPMAVHAHLHEGGIRVLAMVGDVAGREVLRVEVSGDATEPARAGIDAAEALLARGGDRIIAALNAPPGDDG